MKKFLAILMVATVCATVAFSVRAENDVAEDVPETTTSTIEESSVTTGTRDL